MVTGLIGSLTFHSSISFIGVYANNVWQAQNYPFLSQVRLRPAPHVPSLIYPLQLLFYSNGTEYDQTLILNDDFTLNEAKLAVQGLPWFSATQTVAKIGTSLSFGATSLV